MLASLVFAKRLKKKTLLKGKPFHKIRFYDALTASGLRALRFRKEMPEDLIQKVIGCDLSVCAINTFKRNLILNGLEGDDRIGIQIGDTNQVMYSTPEPEKFDIIDLDPYGSMVPFLYTTLNAFHKEGLLCVTCTDTRVLCGSDKHKCYYLYRSARGGTRTIQEHGLRVAVHTINTMANFLGKSVKVLLAVQSDFYIRVFVEVRKSKKEC